MLFNGRTAKNIDDENAAFHRYSEGCWQWGIPLNCDSLLQVGLTDLSPETGFIMNPNPTTGLITCMTPLDFPRVLRMERVDLSGKLVSTFNMIKSVQAIDISNLPAGVYGFILTSESRDVKSREKIILQ